MAMPANAARTIRARLGSRVVFVLSAIMAGALALNCSDSTAPRSSSFPGGLWDFVGQRVDVGPFVTGGASCNESGTFSFVKSDSGWNGSIVGLERCDVDPITAPIRDSAAIVSGVTSGNRFVFVRSIFGETCADTVVVPSGDVTAIDGVEQCDITRMTWHAVRGAPLASISLRSTLLTVVADSLSLVPVMMTASGDNVFGRPVVWASSRPDVATVSFGAITPVTAGSTTISATVEGKTAATNVTVLPPTPLVSVAAGDAISCGLGADQRVYCWGRSLFPQRIDIPEPVQSAETFTSISASQRFACAVSTRQDVWCWGDNSSGQLGIINTVQPDTLVKIVASGLTFTQVTTGGRHACALDPDGHAWCWGANDSGQLGVGSTAGELAPAPVSGGLTFATLNAGDSHTCGLTPAGALYCWGSNQWGQLGDSTGVTRTVPGAVAGSHTFKAVSAGLFHNCGIDNGGNTWCWGGNWDGQFGNGTTTGATFPVAGAIGLTLASISLSENYGCGVTQASAIWCWGFNGTGTWGQLGNGVRLGSPTPVKVSGGLTWASVSTGVYTFSDEAVNEGTAAHTCGVTTGGSTWCWGVNIAGQLGNGTRTESYVPVKVFGQP